MNAATSRTSEYVRSLAIALLAVAIATGAKIALRDLLGRDAPFALLGLAVIAAGSFGGPRSAVAATALSSLAGWYYFLAPFGSFALTEPNSVGRLTALFCEGLVISAIIARVDAAKKDVLRSTARLERLQSLTSELAAAVTPIDVAEVTVRKAVETLGATAGVFVQASANARLEVLAHHGLDPTLATELHSFATDARYPSAVAFERGAPEWIEDATEYVRRYPMMSERLGHGYAAAAALPLRIGERKLGALAFRFERARHFDERERELMETMASQAAQSFERAQMFAEEVRSRNRLEKLNELMDALSTALSYSEVAEIVVECGMRIAGADTCTLYAPDVDGSLRLIGDRGVSASVLDRIRHIRHDSNNPSLTAIQTGETLWAETESDYLAIYPALATMKSDGPRAHAFWSVPLVAEGTTIGLLGMGFYAARRFPPEERSFVEMLTRHCGQALRRAERLEAERRARSLAERLQRSFETTLRSIGDAVIATDAEGRVTLMNHVAEELTGWRESDAKTRTLREVFHIINEQTRAEVQSPVDVVLRDGIVLGLANHTVLVHRDGKRETPIDDSGAPIRGASGELDGVVLVFRDVSVKKHAEQRALILSEASAALTESLDYRATLMRVARLAVPRLADWCAVDVIPEGGGAYERLAVAHVDESKIPIAYVMVEKYQSNPNAHSGVSGVLLSGRSALYPEVSDEMLERAAVDEEHLRLSRALHLRSVMIVPLIARGHVLGAMTMVWAESEGKYDAADLSFAESLAQRCAIAIDNARLYAAEQRARQHADAANRTKDEFLAIMGHELRNPLAPMVTAVQLMQLRQERGADKELAVLDRQIRHMMRLLEDLLDVSRVLRDKVELSRQVLDVSEVVANAVEIATPLIASRQQRLSVDVPPAGLVVDVDPVRMAQVLGNLLMNASKYSDRGGEIKVSARAVGEAVQIAVEDRGVGIEPELMPRLFELFSQGKQGIDRQLGGLGIGLAIASRLVEAHAGSLKAQSEGRGRGSRFTVELPRSHERVSVIPSPPPSLAPSRASKRVLIVDDNEDATELMARLIQRLGHDARVAFEGASALKLASEFEPDVVFLDIGLPGMNGFEVARRMRQLPKCAEIPIIAVTGYARESDRQEAARAGFTEHFAKPIGIERLRDVLDNVRA